MLFGYLGAWILTCRIHIVVGNYVYIDGGEIAMLIDDEPLKTPSTSPHHHRCSIFGCSGLMFYMSSHCHSYDLLGLTLIRADNDTLIIDISKSWTIDDAEFISINKTSSGVLNLINGFLFPAADNKSFFQFGGESTWLLLHTPRNPTSVTQFAIDDHGNGSWAQFEPGSLSGFEEITRPTRALATMVDNTFFILGGYLCSHSAEETANIQGFDTDPLKGKFAWNMTSGLWTNDSMPLHLVRPNGLNGILASVPTFGPGGLLLAGGTGTVNNGAPKFDNITIYEPRDKTWHYQSTTGDIPAGRNGPCTVGVPGDFGAYEMYVQGLTQRRAAIFTQS